MGPKSVKINQELEIYDSLDSESVSFSSNSSPTSIYSDLPSQYDIPGSGNRTGNMFSFIAPNSGKLKLNYLNFEGATVIVLDANYNEFLSHMLIKHYDELYNLNPGKDILYL